MGDIFKTDFNEAKWNLEEKFKNMTGTSLGLKRKRKPKTFQSQGEHRRVKDIFTEEKKKK